MPHRTYERWLVNAVFRPPSPATKLRDLARCAAQAGRPAGVLAASRWHAWRPLLRLVFDSSFWPDRNLTEVAYEPFEL